MVMSLEEHGDVLNAFKRHIGAVNNALKRMG